MVGVRVITTSGTHWETSINGTEEEINNYFLGTYFNVGMYPMEQLEKVVKVEFI